MNATQTKRLRNAVQGAIKNRQDYLKNSESLKENPQVAKSRLEATAELHAFEAVLYAVVSNDFVLIECYSGSQS